jgi:hypothetical protein
MKGRREKEQFLVLIGVMGLIKRFGAGAALPHVLMALA